MIKKTLAVLSILLLFQFESAQIFAQSENQEKPTFEEIYKNYSFIDTADVTDFFEYSKDEVGKERKRLKEEEAKEKKALKKEQRSATETLRRAQKDLKGNTKQKTELEEKYTEEKVFEVTVDGKKRKKKEKVLDQKALSNDPEYQSLLEKRSEIECRIKEWQIKSSNKTFEHRKDEIKIKYQIHHTYLDFLIKWPRVKQKIDEDIASGKALDRKFGDWQDIGNRYWPEFRNQEDDTKYLQNPQMQQVLEELERKQYENPYIRDFIVDAIQEIAKNSDLKVPVDEKYIFVIDEEDINAFAMPGPVIVVTIGLLREVETVAELYGVLAHEIAHVVARHAHRRASSWLMRGLQIASLAALFTPLWWLSYYGAFGFGINLAFLGITRDFEREADQLGIQYLKKLNIDPRGFITFFEKLGRKSGDLRGISFFRTHPVHEDRMIKLLKEYKLLAPHGDYIVNTTEFLKMKAHLCVDGKIAQEEKALRKKRSERPTLRRKEQKEEAQEEKARHECGIETPEETEELSFCEAPELQSFIEEIRARHEAESKEEKEEVELKRN